MSDRVWKPNSSKQETFLSLPDSIFEACYGGAAGGGKTETLIMLPLIRGFHQESQFKGIIFRRTFKQLERSIIPRAQAIYAKTGARYNGNDYVFTWPSGAKLWVGYLETDQHARQYDSDEYNLIEFEELAQFTESQYTYLTSRCRTATNLPAIMRNAATPGNIGNRWVYERFVKPAPQGFKRLVDKKLIGPDGRRIERIFIPAFAMENPDLITNDPTYLLRLQLLSPAEQRAKIEGDWLAFEGQVFSEFRTKPGFNEPENACHVIKPFDIPEWWPKIIAIDWGYDHKTVVHWLAVSPEGRTYIYREYVCRKTEVAVWGADVAALSQNEEFVDGVLDSSSDVHRGEEETLWDQIIRATGMRFLRPADRDRIGGKILYHEMLRWRPRPPKYMPEGGYDRDLAMYILRTQGPEAWKKYENAFIPEPPETNIPKLQIFDTCDELINVLPMCSFDERRIEDVAKFDGDDAYDSSRYGLKAVQAYLERAKRELVKRHKIQLIIQDLQRTGNQTAFYRAMEKVESKRKKFGVKRNPYGRPDVARYGLH